MYGYVVLIRSPRKCLCFSDANWVELPPLVRQYQIVVPVGNEVRSWGLDEGSINMQHSVVVTTDHAVHLGHLLENLSYS